MQTPSAPPEAASRPKPTPSFPRQTPLPNLRAYLPRARHRPGSPPARSAQSLLRPNAVQTGPTNRLSRAHALSEISRAPKVQRAPANSAQGRGRARNLTRRTPAARESQEREAGGAAAAARTEHARAARGAGLWIPGASDNRPSQLAALGNGFAGWILIKRILAKQQQLGGGKTLG